MIVTSRGSLNFVGQIGYLLGPLDKDAQLANSIRTTYESIGYWMSCTCHKSHEILEIGIGEVFLMVEKVMKERIMRS